MVGLRLDLGWCQQARRVAAPTSRTCCIVIMHLFLLLNVNQGACALRVPLLSHARLFPPCCASGFTEHTAATTSRAHH
jgi:hypothetical protein